MDLGRVTLGQSKSTDLLVPSVVIRFNHSSVSELRVDAEMQ